MTSLRGLKRSCIRTLENLWQACDRYTNYLVISVLATVVWFSLAIGAFVQTGNSVNKTFAISIDNVDNNNGDAKGTFIGLTLIFCAITYFAYLRRKAAQELEAL